MSSPTSARRYVKRSYSSPCDRSDNEPSTPTRSSTRSTHHHTPSNGKMVAIKVVLLDDSVTIIQSQSKTLGRIIFDQIIKQLNVLEADYFGLEYNDENGVHYWLDLEKRLTRQVGLNLSEPLLKFSVKFYTPDPSQLEEEFTRYLFSLEIKRDLSSGVLLCNDNTAALMASFIVQAECGDFSEEDYPDATYLSVYKFIPHQNYELERKIRECHKKHVGQSPAEADLHLLETARRTEMYGIRLHPARDEDGVHLNLSVCHMGVLVFQNNTKINTFSWAKIRKISFKRKRFILKLHPESYGYYKELVEFVFDSRNECKSYWKRCVEHHAFFRCEKAPNPIQRSKGILSSRGSSFRYSGRTQKQMVQFVRENFVKRPPGQYLSQQNLASDNQQAEWKRSSSFKTAKTTKSANNLEYEDDEEEDEMEFSDYTVEKKSPTKSSITSSPLLQQPPLPQLQLFPQNHQNQNIEAHYYSTKQLVNNFRTYFGDLVLIGNAGTDLVQVAKPVKTIIDSDSVLNLMRKHTYEVKHGEEIRAKIARSILEESYIAFFEEMQKNYGLIVSQDCTNHYQSLCCLLLKPFQWVNYCWTVHKIGSEKLCTLQNTIRSQLLTIGKTIELKRDIIGLDLQQDAWGEFLRQGVLLKLNRKKGLQARIVFLFRNILIYATRISSSSGFRLHGVLRTSQLQLQTDCITGIPHSITITVQEEVEKMLILSAFSQESKAEWTTALEDAISSNTSIHINTNNNWTSSEEFEPPPLLPSITTPPLSRSNLTTHVCWHRNLSISNEFILSHFPKSMSSYLLRKFKSSPGWQRLWVVYSNLVLYFHKCHDSLEPPLASLPLLGYSVETTDKPHTFKLSFKNHVYYFKAESPHVSDEWVGLLGGVSGK